MKACMIFVQCLFLSMVLGQNPLYNYNQFINQSIESFGFLTANTSNITFRLWTRNQTTTYIPLTIGQLGSVLPAMSGSKIFKIITHGYLNNADVAWVTNMKNKYLIKSDYNVILVDWRNLANRLYPISAGYTKAVGNYLGALIYNLNRTLGVPYSNIHMIGHSLGAHISGFAGKYIQSLGGNVSRISGCDPAGPLFFLTKKNNRLSNNDAIFVDIIHTDSLMYGYILPLGDIDFYPNGGVAPQPGCSSLGNYNDIVGGCSHTRSHDFFIESINSNGFISSKCNSSLFYIYGLCSLNIINIMGENVYQNQRGIYQLTTNSAPPYAKYGVL